MAEGMPHSDLDADNDRQALIEAARVLLERSGERGFKVSNVLRTAGLSTRTFYRHFQTKDDLLLGVVEVELAEMASRLRSATEKAETPTDKVRAYLKAMLDVAYSPQAGRSSLVASHWRNLINEHPESIARISDVLMAPLQEALTGAVKAGEARAQDPKTDAAVIFYMVAGIAVDQAALRSSSNRTEVERMALGFANRALGMVQA